MAKILLVEDIELVRLTLARMLKGAGHEVTLATDGLEAVSILRHSNFDVALVDIGMPRMDGLALLKHIRAAKASFPVIILSGGDPKAPLETSFGIAEANGAFAVMVKPVEDEDLLNAIAKAVAA